VLLFPPNVIDALLIDPTDESPNVGTALHARPLKKAKSCGSRSTPHWKRDLPTQDLQ